MAENLELNLLLKGGAKSIKTIGELEEGLAQAREEIKGVAKGSADFERLATAIQDASSEVKTLEKQMEGLEPQQKAEAFLKMGEGIAGGFVAAQGAMGLMGIESENLEKIQVKVQSAIAIAMGVRMMSEAALMASTAKRVFLEKASTVTTKANTVVTYAAAAAQKVLSKGLGITVKGLKGLKVAVMATGVGALAVGIGALVSKLSGSKGANKGLSDFEKRMNAVSRELEEANRLLGRDREKMLRDVGEVEENSAQKRLRETKELIEDKKALIETLKAEEEATSQQQKTFNFIQRHMGFEEAERYWNEQARLGNVSIDAADSYATAIEKVNDEIIALGESTVDLEKDTIMLGRAQEFIVNKFKQIQDAAKEQKQEQDKRREDRKKQREQDAVDTLALEQELILLKIEDENDRARKELEIQEQNDIAKLEGVLNFNEQKKLIEDKYKLLNQDLENEINDAWWENFMAQNDAWNEAQLEEQERIEETKQKDLDAIEARKAARDTLTGHQLAALGQISGLLKDGSVAAKAAALTDIAVNTGVGLMQALDIAQKSAKGTGPAAAFAFPIFYASQIAAVLGAANQAKSILGAGGGTSGPSDTGDTSVPDTMQPASGAFTLGGGIEQEPVRAFVVTDELSDSQDMLANIRRRSTI